jgi:hypothetical protein
MAASSCQPQRRKLGGGGRRIGIVLSDREKRREGGGFGDQQGIEVGVELLRGDQPAAAGVEDRGLGARRDGLGEQAEDVVAAGARGRASPRHD